MENFSPISALLMTYSYAQKHHKNYNIMLQELSNGSRRMAFKMNIAKIKVMGVDNTPINVNNVLIENVEAYAYLGQPYSLKEMYRDKEGCQMMMICFSCEILLQVAFK